MNDEQARDWLSQYGRSKQIGRPTTALTLGDFRGDQQEYRAGVRRRAKLRLTCACLVIAGAGWAAGAMPAAVLLVIVALVVMFVGWDRNAGTVARMRDIAPWRVWFLSLSAPAVAALIDRSHWWFGVCGSFVVLAIPPAIELRELLRPAYWNSGPLFGFVPRSTIFGLVISGQWSLFTTALDLAVGSHGDRADLFLNAIRTADPPSRALVHMALARTALHRGDVDRAVTLAAEAIDTANDLDAPVRGWLRLQLAVILLATGRPKEAAVQRILAIGLLRGRRCRRTRRLAETEHLRHLQHVDSAAEGLRVIHRLRLVGRRRCDPDLLDATEAVLVSMLIEAGNFEGATRSIKAITGDGDLSGGRLHWLSDWDAGDLAVWAAFLARFRETTPTARRLATAALDILGPDRSDLAGVAARLVLADLDMREGRAGEATDHLSRAVGAVQAARYGLPSARWRRAWTLLQVEAYARLLEAVTAQGDTLLIAEALELVRGEVLPLEDERRLAVHRNLESVLSEAFTAAGISRSVDLVRQPPVTRVGQRLRLSPVGSDFRNLELELLAVAGHCWYWNGTTARDRYHWTVRSPAGEWWHGSTDLDGTVLAELAASLPHALPGEESADVRQRVKAGALVRAAGPERELELLARVARLVLPSPLSDGLRAADPETRLVVSLSTALGHIPIAALPLHGERDLRVAERAVTVTVPSWALVADARSRERALATQWPVRLAVLDPSGRPRIRWIVEPPPQVKPGDLLKCPVGYERLSVELNRRAPSRSWTLYLAGDVSVDPAAPAWSGFALAPDGDRPDMLSLSDLIAVGDDGKLRFPMPERVVLVGCGSLGLEPPSTVGVRTPTGEWQGVAAGVLLAGGRHVYCTLYPVSDSAQLRDIAHRLAGQMVSSSDPAAALRRIQLDELNRWRTGKGNPMTWQAFVYTGVGSDQ